MPGRQRRVNISGTSIYHLPLGIWTEKFPFSVLEVRYKSDRALALLAPPGSFYQTGGGRVSGGRACVPRRGDPTSIGAPRALPGVAAGFRGGAPVSGGRLRQREGVPEHPELREPCDLLAIQAHLPGPKDPPARVAAGEGGRRQVPLRPEGRGGSPEPLCLGGYYKSSRKSFLQNEGQ